jgi:NAD(P)-dependent dehydrogenase (short-subunit alcohol dehydrogenase family)
MRLDGVPAMVTGGSMGLGGATAALLAEAGARISIIDVKDETGEAHASLIGGVYIRADVTDFDSVSHAISLAEKKYGVTRILVNCAGITEPRKTLSDDGEIHPLSLFRRVIDVNLVGTFNVLTQVAARMKSADLVGDERGVIINTASIAGFDGQSGQAAYASSKAAVIGLIAPSGP